MAFVKKSWLARLGQGLNKFILNGGSRVTLESSPDTVTQQGTPLSAENMNDLEQRIADEFSNQSDAINAISTRSSLAKILYNGQTIRLSGIVTDSPDGVAYFNLPLQVQPTSTTLGTLLIPGVTVISGTSTATIVNNTVLAVTNANLISYKGKCALLEVNFSYE